MKDHVLTKGFLFALFFAVAAVGVIVLLARAERIKKEEADAKKAAYWTAETARAAEDARNGIHFSSDWTILQKYPSSRTDETYTVPGCVSQIAPGAFAAEPDTAPCKLTSVILPPSVKIIGEKAFLNQTALKTIQLPPNIKKIGAESFANTGLTSIALPDGVISIDKGAFRDCGSLTSVALPKTLSVIGSGAFQNCRNLETLTFPEGLLRIGENAFSGCDHLKTEIPH